MQARHATWDILRLLLRGFIALFGAPSAIALKRAIPRALRDRALKLLRLLEAAARRLLVRDALTAPRENARFRPTGFPSPSYRCGRSGFASDDSADWDVSFRAIPAARRRREARRARRNNTPSVTVSACALAERLEALLRVTRDPMRWARRLARRIRTNAREAPDLLIRALGRDRPVIHWPRRAFHSSA